MRQTPDNIQLLIDSGAPALLIRDKSLSTPLVGIFDYNTLNAYLLTVVGIARPSDDEQLNTYAEIAQKASQGKAIPLSQIRDLGRKDPVTYLAESANLTKAIETFGKGVHRAVIVKQGADGRAEICGVLSQTRLVRFLWENGRSFPALEQLYGQYLRDLRIGSNNVIAIK